MLVCPWWVLLCIPRSEVCAYSGFTVCAVSWSVSSAKVLVSIVVVAMQNQQKASAHHAWPSHCRSSCCSCTEGRGFLGDCQEPSAPGETHPSAFSDYCFIHQISDTGSQGCSALQSLVICLKVMDILWHTMQVSRQYRAVLATSHGAFACAACGPGSMLRLAILLSSFQSQNVYLIQKCHPYSGNLNSEKSEDSKNAFPHSGDV